MNPLCPPSYVCAECGAHGVKLWREYSTCLEYITLRCHACARVNQKKGLEDASERELSNIYCIGWLVLAVPTNDGTY